MFRLSSLALFGLFAAAGIPYLLSSNSDREADDQPSAAAHAPASDSALPASPPMQPAAHVAGLTGPPPSAETMRTTAWKHFSQVMRFDVSPDWVMTHWPRVSGDVPVDSLQGYRVPLVTGTQLNDLAGSLTYYFDPQQTLVRITFTGTTGDPQRLVDFLQHYYGFERRVSRDASEHLYVYTQFGRTRHQLRVRPIPIVQSAQGHLRYKVSLNLTRPPHQT